MELARFFGFLHPALVHFPLVLLLVSVVLEAIGFFGKDKRFTWVAQITLIIGTTATLFAFVAGNFAEVWAARDGIPQDPMEYHELLATITSWTFIFLTAGRLFLGAGAHRKWMAAYLIAATVACILLGITGHQGAMLVYNHGAGVQAAGLPPLVTHEDLVVLLQKQDPEALFYSNKMHHVFGVMVMLLSLMLLIDLVSPRWGEHVRRFAPFLLLAGGIYLMIFSDQDAWPLYQVKPFRPWSDKEVLMHKTYAILMILAASRGFWQLGKELHARRRAALNSGSPAPGLNRKAPNAVDKAEKQTDEGRQLYARMMAIFALVGGGLLFTHVHSNAPYANVAAGVYIHHTAMGFLALCIGAVKLIEDALLQQRAARALRPELRPDQGQALLGAEKQPASRPVASSTILKSRLPRFLAWAYPTLMLIESVFLINYNEGLPWFLGYANLALTAPHQGLTAPLGPDRAEFVYDPTTQRIDIYVLNQSNDRPHSIKAASVQAYIKIGTDSTAVDLVPATSGGSASHFTGTASFLRNVPMFQLMALVRPKGQPAAAAPLSADFEPWIDVRMAAPHSIAAFVCPMHPAQGDVKPGTCTLCGMALVANKPPRPWNKLADDAYHMDLVLYALPAVGTKTAMTKPVQIAHTDPPETMSSEIMSSETMSSVSMPAKQRAPGSAQDDMKANQATLRDTETHALVERALHRENLQRVTQPAAGQKVLLDLLPRHADGSPIKNLAVVHTKKLHLIVASKDLSYFDHVHPELQPAGDLLLEYRFPHPGEYVLYADCTPAGDRNQVFRLPVTVAGTAPGSQPLFVTPAQGRTFGSYRVAMTLTPAPPQLNDEVQLRFMVSKDGLPVTDIEPFLGAGGHCVILSEDTRGYLHSHPTEMGGERFGPAITFHTQFPRRGIYKIWAQFQHQGKPLTADFVIQVP